MNIPYCLSKDYAKLFTIVFPDLGKKIEVFGIFPIFEAVKMPSNR